MKSAAIATTLLLHAAAIGTVVHLHSGRDATQSSVLPLTVTLALSPGAVATTPTAIASVAKTSEAVAFVATPAQFPNSGPQSARLAKPTAENAAHTLASAPIPFASVVPKGSSTDASVHSSSDSPSVATIKTGASIPASYADSNRKPAYPLLSRRQEEQGTVLLRIRVMADGTAGDIHVWKTSGYPLLDESAVHAVQNWRFTPASINNKPVAEWYQIAIPFKLHN